MLLLLGLAGVWLRSSVPDRFANYQVRMVSEAQRGHTMGQSMSFSRRVLHFDAGG